MEVLNQNQRNSALWRLFAFGILTIAIISTSIISVYDANTSMLQRPLDECEKKYESEKRIWLGKNQQLSNDNGRLEKELNELKKNNSEPNQQMSILKAQLDLKEERIQGLNEELNRCKSDLRAANPGD